LETVQDRDIVATED